MCARRVRHNSEDVIDEFGGNVGMKQVAHRVDEDHAGVPPLARQVFLTRPWSGRSGRTPDQNLSRLHPLGTLDCPSPLAVSAKGSVRSSGHIPARCGRSRSLRIPCGLGPLDRAVIKRFPTPRGDDPPTASLLESSGRATPRTISVATLVSLRRQRSAGQHLGLSRQNRPRCPQSRTPPRADSCDPA